MINGEDHRGVRYREDQEEMGEEIGIEIGNIGGMIVFEMMSVLLRK